MDLCNVVQVSVASRKRAGHGAVIEGESPLWGLAEVTMSESQHRTKVNLQVGLPVWASGILSVTPNIRSWSGGSGCGTLLCLSPGDLDRSRQCVERPTDLAGMDGGNNFKPISIEKSDHLVVVTKPGNAGGANQRDLRTVSQDSAGRVLPNCVS